MGFRDLLQLVLGWWSRAKPSAGCVERVGVFTPGAQLCGLFIAGAESVGLANLGSEQTATFVAGAESTTVDCHGRATV